MAGQEAATRMLDFAIREEIYDRIQAMFDEKDESRFLTAVFRYYTFDSHGFLEKRVQDKEKYDVALRQEFMA